MKIAVIGTGYVGLTAGACFADMGNTVICIDNNEEKIKQLQNGIIPIYEPGLEELVKSNTAEKRLSFSIDLDSAVKDSQICFICTGTPQAPDGSCDLKYVNSAAKAIAEAMNEYKVIVNKSTVPIGTAEKIAEIIRQNTEHPFDIVSNPEFLKQGNAVDDFLSPDRVIIGADSDKAARIMQELYSPFFRTGSRVILMDVKSAEMTKYASNSLLAVKISFMNEIAALCEKTGADAERVRIGMAADTRIGSKFLFPGLGYGGSCFPKDVKAIVKTAEEYGVSMSIIKCAGEINKKQRELFIEKITNKFGTDLKGKIFAVWGLAFKPKTNDMREAPSITIINALLDMGAEIKACDPKALETAKAIFKDKIEYFSNAYDALKDADAMLLITEWNEFRRPDFERMKTLMKLPVIFDGRNQYNPDRMKEKGFDYCCTGRCGKAEKLFQES